MVTVVLQALGVVAFLAGSAGLGRRLERVKTDRAARSYSRVSHALFWLCLIAPGLVGFVSPGLTHYDEVLGVPPLPARPVTLIVGGVLVAAGLWLMAAANHALAKLGGGRAAFLLTERVVSEGIYRRTRNPMSLGFYMACVGVGLAAGSTVLTLGALGLIVPAHVFNLRYFEERELALRYGNSYLQYKADTPFLFPEILRGRG